MNPQRWRKKPVVISAVQITQEMVEAAVLDNAPLPDGLQLGSRTYHRERRKVYSVALYVETLEGRMNVEVGDWLITGVKGEHYPCKPDVFAATYEPAPDDEPAASLAPQPQVDRAAGEKPKVAEVRALNPAAAWPFPPRPR